MPHSASSSVPPTAACPRCGNVTSHPFAGAGGVCLRCAGERAFALGSDTPFESLHPDPAVPSASSSPVSDLPAQIGPYEIIEELGRGGMGRVYAARQRGLGRIVALKVLTLGPGSPVELEMRFLREAQTVARLRHPHIVAIHDSGRTGGHVFFSMDYLEGGDLARRLRERPLPPREAAALIAKVADALAFAHAEGVLHRDLKPSNILLDGDEPRLADFGLATHLETSGDLTSASGLFGTPHYLAPEALRGGGAALTAASDLYALGIVLYAILTGRTPFVGASPAELPALINDTDPPAPGLLAPAVPRDLATICLKCLEREPARRYATAAALAADLRRFLAGEPIAARPPGGIERFRRFARRHRAPLLSAIGAFVVLAVATAVSTSLAIRATRAEKLAAAEAAAALAVSEFLSRDLLAQASPRQDPDRDLKLRTVVDRAAKKIEGRFADQPHVEAALREILCSTYSSLGEYALAKPQLERALELNRQLHGPDAAATLRLAASLAICQLGLGDRVAAERQAREILARQQRVLGHEYPDTLATTRYLAQILQASSQHAEATALLRETFATRTRVIGADARETLETGSILADCLSSQGKLAESQQLRATVLAAQRRVLGPEDSATLRTLIGMGSTCIGAGQLTEGIRIFREALPPTQRLFGPESVNALTLMGQLANGLRLNGEPAEAEAVLQQALPLLRRTRGPEHPSTLGTMENLASALRAQQRFPEAETLLREALAAFRRSSRPPPTTMTNILLSLAGVYQDQGKFADAESLAHEALELCNRTLGPKHPTTSNVMWLTAAIYHDQRRYDDALALFRETAELQRTALAPEHVSRLTTLYSMAYTLQALGRPAEATPLLREVFEGRLRQIGAAHPGTLAARDRLAQTLILQQQFAEAETLLRTNLPLRLDSKTELWRLSDTQSLLGEALSGLGRDAEAEPLLLAAQEKLQSLAPTLPARVRSLARDATDRLARFYVKVGNKEAADHWQDVATRLMPP